MQMAIDFFFQDSPVLPKLDGSNLSIPDKLIDGRHRNPEVVTDFLNRHNIFSPLFSFSHFMVFMVLSGCYGINLKRFAHKPLDTRELGEKDGLGLNVAWFF